MPLDLLWTVVLCFAGCIRREAVDECNDDLLDVDLGVKGCTSGEERAQGAKVKVVGKDLDDHLHEILLCDDIFAVNDLLEDGREDGALVHLEIDAFELAESDEVGADEDAQLFAFHLAFLAVSGVTLMLQSDPELVHLDKVGEDKADAVLEVTARSHILADGEVVASSTAEIVTEKETSSWMLNTSAHLHDVLHDFLDGSVGYRHVYASHGDHEVETGYDVSAILHELVQVGEVMFAGRVSIVEVDGQMSQCVKDGHIWAQAQQDRDQERMSVGMFEVEIETA